MACVNLMSKYCHYFLVDAGFKCLSTVISFWSRLLMSSMVVVFDYQVAFVFTMVVVFDYLVSCNCVGSCVAFIVSLD